MGYTSTTDVLVAQINILNEIPAFQHQVLLQNTFFVSLVTKLASAMVQQEINEVVKNSYFKLPANNLTLSTLKESFLDKIESNIKADKLFFHFLIKEVKKVNPANGDNNTSAITFLVVNSKED